MLNIDKYKRDMRNIAQYMVWATENKENCELSVYLPMHVTTIVDRKTKDNLIFLNDDPKRFGFAFEFNGYSYETNESPFHKPSVNYLRDNKKHVGVEMKTISEEEFLKAYSELLKQYGGKVKEFEENYLK